MLRFTKWHRHTSLPSSEVGTIERVSGHHRAASARHRRHAEAGLDQHLPREDGSSGFGHFKLSTDSRWAGGWASATVRRFANKVDGLEILVFKYLPVEGVL